MKLTTIILLVVIYEVVKIHIKINSEDKDVCPANSNTVGKKDVKRNTNITINKDNTEKGIDIKDVKSKPKIKDKKSEKVNKSSNLDELVKDTIFAMTEERLTEIEKDEEEQQLLLDKLNFKSIINNDNDEEYLVGNDMVEIDYNAILNTDFKIALAQEIQNQEEFKWYDDPKINKESNVEIPTKKFKVVTYNY